jgi:hypothetical protein
MLIRISNGSFSTFSNTIRNIYLIYLNSSNRDSRMILLLNDRGVFCSIRVINQLSLTFSIAGPIKIGYHIFLIDFILSHSQGKV